MFLYDLLVMYFVYVVKTTKRFLVPRREAPPPINGVSLLARILAVGAALFINVGWHVPTPGFLFDYGVGSLIRSVSQTLPLIVLSIIIATVVMVALAEPRYRRMSLRELSRPICSIALTFGSMAIGIGACVGCFALVSYTDVLGGFALFGTFALIILLAALCYTVFAMLVAVVRTMQNHLFAVRDAHPMMPAVVSVILVGVSAAPEIYATARSGFDSNSPMWAGILALTVVPALGLAAAFFELWWLRREGLSFRLPGSKQPYRQQTYS